MDNEIKEKIRQLAEPVVASEGMELIHVECIKMHSRWIIRLFLDKECGITLDDCANISNQLGDIFDIREVINSAYTLEVSSPGLDRPISRDQDFVKYKNSNVIVKTNEKIDGIKNFRGILTDFIEEAGRKMVLIEIAGKIYRIPRQEVVKANLVDDGDGKYSKEN
ncbi:MAG: ribosome maturation factor RimP [Deltaproteobacteria bacterium HGW-Deltaproteobacteria-13]|jgi:ribosome maturation factor RimP|nr:MAG: ribosome maturation factor RimP [Deltaproteobacteria bacterium HGW-Deltaproteobacteria-13]